MAARRLTRVERTTTSALLLRRVEVGEADLIVTLLSETWGLCSARARSARRSRRRFVGVEPFHRLRVELERPPERDMASLLSAEIEEPRLRMADSLDRLDAGGLLLRWLRQAATPAADARLWHAANAILDELNALSATDATKSRVDAVLVSGGLTLLDALGWSFDLASCAVCGKPCAEGAAALADPRRGGLVCRSCGGGPLKLTGAQRAALAHAARGDIDGALAAKLDGESARRLIEGAFARHVDR